jgi:hypothetical protein
MSRLASFRTPAHVVAPLRECPAEGAQATELRQDKTDSLRPCPAVVLSLFISTFTQAVHSTRSLSIFSRSYSAAFFFTSSAFSHVS